MLMPVQLKPDVWWVGGVDWNAREFHGYTTEAGITYNAYLILDEKVTLIDTTKVTFADDLIERISHLIDPSKIEVIISNHVEMDHSGGLPRIAELAPNATVYASDPAGLRGLAAHYGDAYNYVGVKTGDTLSIGKRTLTFVQTPMVHFPDNMLTYSDFDKILFSNDSFGQHFASSGRFDDENDLGEVLFQARKYYANIVLPYGAQVKKELATVAEVIGMDNIEMIAPAHGVIWRSHADKVIEAYQRFVSDEMATKALVVYDTMWGSTEKMAKEIVEAFYERGIRCRLMGLHANHPSDIMTRLMDAKYICVGSPTLNMQMLPQVASFLTYMRGLSPKNGKRYGLAFGSYGWAPVGPKGVGDVLADCGFQMPVETVTHNWIPGEEAIEEVRQAVFSLIDAAEAAE